MGIIRIVTPVEYSFHRWVSAYPDSGHPSDKKRFYIFARTIAHYHAKKWKNTEYVEERILKIKPHFDPEYLKYLMGLLVDLLEYSMVAAIDAGNLDFEVTDNHVLEIRVKNDKVEMKEKPLRPHNPYKSL